MVIYNREIDIPLHCLGCRKVRRVPKVNVYTEKLANLLQNVCLHVPCSLSVVYVVMPFIMYIKFDYIFCVYGHEGDALNIFYDLT